MKLGQALKAGFGKFLAFFRKNSHKASQLISTAKDLVPLGVEIFSDMRQALSQPGQDPNQEAPLDLVARVNLIVQTVNKLLIGLGERGLVPKFGSTYTQLATKFDEVSSAFERVDRQWNTHFVGPMIELSSKVPPDLNETRTSWLTRCGSDVNNLENISKVQSVVDIMLAMHNDQGRDETSIIQVPSTDWLEDRPRDLGSIRLMAAVTSCDEILAGLEVLDPNSAPGSLGDIPVDNSRTIYFPVTELDSALEIDDVATVQFLTSAIPLAAAVSPATSEAKITFTGNEFAVISNGADYWMTFRLTCTTAGDYSVYTTNSEGVAVNHGYIPYNGTRQVVTAYPIGAGAIVNVRIKMSPYISGDQYLMNLCIASSGAGGPFSIAEFKMVSVPNEVSTDVSSLIRCISGGHKKVLPTDIFSELFFSEYKMVTIDKDLSMQGYINEQFDQGQWDLIFHLLWSVSKRQSKSLPTTFAADTGLTADIAGYQNFLSHFINFGPAGFLVNGTNAEGVVTATPLAPADETAKVNVYNHIRSLITNLIFTLRSETPREYYQTYRRALRADE
jgi:hypothetical protein